MKRIFIVVLIVLSVCGDVRTQVESPPVVSDDVKRQLSILQAQVSGLEFAKAVLQEKIDAATAEYNRAIARLQAAAPAGYELSPQLTYVKKKEGK